MSRKVNTNELTGAALDWAVAKCEGIDLIDGRYNRLLVDGRMSRGQEMMAPYKPSTDWAQGGPIIEREGISVAADTAGMFDSFVWFASVDDILVDADEAIGVRGPTPLIAAMRCYVASKLGEEVEIPDELLEFA